MALTKNKNLRMLKQKTENMLILSHGIRNTNAYIEKQLYGFRFLNLSLDGWDNLSVQAMILCFLIGGIAAFGSYWYRCESYYIVLYGTMGILSGLSLVFIDNSVNISVKRQQLVDCLIDYVDNTPYFIRSVDKSANADGVERRIKNAAESSNVRSREMGTKNLKVVDELESSRQDGETSRENLKQGYLNVADNKGETARDHGKFSILSRKKGHREPVVSRTVKNSSGRGAASPGDITEEQESQGLAPEEELRRSIDGLKQSLQQIAASREQAKSDVKTVNLRVQENGGSERAKRELSQEDIKLLGELLQEYLT